MYQTEHEAENALYEFTKGALRETKSQNTKERTEILLEYLGRPDNRYKIIHIAGTSGKTSTAYYIATLLQKSNKKVGCSISPHIQTIRERIRINSNPISEELFCKYVAEIIEDLRKAPFIPSWYECMILLSLWSFAEEQVEYVVLETGVGGLLDATNAVNPEDKVCVITDLGLDHQEILGETIEKIAYQKAGIIHDHNTVWMFDQDINTMQVIRYWVSQHEGAELFTFEQTQLEKVFHSLIDVKLPLYQQRNWLLAYSVYLYIAKRDNLKHIESDGLRASQYISIPSRMQIVAYKGKKFLLDGAHNIQKMDAFVKSLKHKWPHQNFPVVFASKEGKDVTGMLELLIPISTHFYVTKYENTYGYITQATATKKIETILSNLEVDCSSTEQLGVALEESLAEKSEIIVVTGSFLLTGQALNYLQRDN